MKVIKIDTDTVLQDKSNTVKEIVDLIETCGQPLFIGYSSWLICTVKTVQN
jgi:hypothetical protein